MGLGVASLSVSSVPLAGPWYSTFTRLVLVWHEYHGTERLCFHALHQQNGPVLRLGINEACFRNADALEVIYGAVDHVAYQCSFLLAQLALSFGRLALLMEPIVRLLADVFLSTKCPHEHPM